MSATSAHPTPSPAPPTGRDPSTVRTLLRLWPFVRPVRVRVFTAALVAVAASCLGLVIPLVLKWIVDGPVADRDPHGVWLGALYLLVLGIAEALLFGCRRWLVARPLAAVEASMRAALYERLQRLPLAFHDRWPSGQLLSRATTDLMTVRMFLAFPLTFLLVNTVTIVAGIGILVSLDVLLGILVVLPAPLLVWLCWHYERQYSEAARRAQDQTGDLTTVTEESVLGIRIVKGFGRHRRQSEVFGKLAKELRGTELFKARVLAAIWGVITTLPELALAAALVAGTWRVSEGGLSAGTLVAFLSTALALRWPVESLGFLLAMSQESATATIRYFEVMDTEPEQETHTLTAGAPAGAAPAVPAPAPAAAAGGPHRGPGHADGLRLEKVVFRHPDTSPGTTPVLDGVDLHVRAGETLALVGTTGSGKTTLTALVPRLHEVTSGTITLDGRDITTMSREELRSLVAVAFEEPTLFSASVAENVLMGAGTPKSGADSLLPADGHEEHRSSRDVPGPGDPLGPGAPDGGAVPGGEHNVVGDHADEALRRALDIAQAGFVDALPEGVDTRVGEQGLSLSGGQRQRLALARAVVGRPPFLVLDDPLSALDVHTEALVEEALRHVLAGTTALVVAHRPSTVLLADRVALLSGGRITAVGTHHELLRTSAEYAWLMSGVGDGRAQEPPPATGPPDTGPPGAGTGTVAVTPDPAGPHALGSPASPVPENSSGGGSR